MARKDEDRDLYYIIPENFKESNVTTNGIPYRNLIEAVILIGLVALIMWILPIPIKIKVVVGIIIAAILGIFAIKGINKCSLSEYLIYFIQFKLSPKTYIRREPFVK